MDMWCKGVWMMTALRRLLLLPLRRLLLLPRPLL